MKKIKKSTTKNLNKKQKYRLNQELEKDKNKSKKDDVKFINQVIEMLFF